MGICVGIHPGRVEPALPIELTTSRTEAPLAQRSCASSIETFTQPFLHRAWPNTRGPERGSRSALIVVAHVLSWPPVPLRHVWGGVGRSRSLIRSPSGRLESQPNRRVERGGCCHCQRPPTPRRLLVQAISRNRRAKSIAPLPYPLYTMLIPAASKDRTAGGPD